jgi:hypothetical protein
VVRILTRVKQQRGVPKLSFCDNRKRVHQSAIKVLQIAAAA